MIVMVVVPTREPRRFPSTSDLRSTPAGDGKIEGDRGEGDTAGKRVVCGHANLAAP